MSQAAMIESLQTDRSHLATAISQQAHTRCGRLRLPLQLPDASTRHRSAAAVVDRGLSLAELLLEVGDALLVPTSDAVVLLAERAQPTLRSRARVLALLLKLSHALLETRAALHLPRATAPKRQYPDNRLPQGGGL
eukprot:2188312-Pleurochrysis_carterae.AAC.1